MEKMKDITFPENAITKDFVDIDETAIAKKLGMELEEVLRLKQVKGVANFFKNEEYSNSWKII